MGILYPSPEIAEPVAGLINASAKEGYDDAKDSRESNQTAGRDICAGE